MENHMELCFDALSVNESFARMAVVAFMSELDPTLEEIEDVRMAVSEAVTNAVIHGYNINQEEKTSQEDVVDKEKVWVRCRYDGKNLEIVVEDKGVGIVDVHKAMEPFYTTDGGHERAGMGFAFMNAFMDELVVDSKLNEGTIVKMKKEIGRGMC